MKAAGELCATCGTDLALVRAAGLIGHVCNQPGPGDEAPARDWPALPSETSDLDAAGAARVLLEDLLNHRYAMAELDEETPGRLAKALGEMLEGYGEDLPDILKTFPLEGDPGVVAVRNLPFSSLCRHHCLPFFGTASVAYLPLDRIVGLSKLPRLLRAYSRRLQVQEQLGQQVAEALMLHVGARGAMVVIRGRHTCMSCRGIESTGEMVTSCVRGVFRDDVAARAEVLSLIG